MSVLVPSLKTCEVDLYAYMLPVFLLLLANSFFLIWIMVIVVYKLKSNRAQDYNQRHMRAARALVIIIPLLGFTYLLTLVGPSKEDSENLFVIYEGIRASLLSFQGLIITLPYCFFNGEVQGVLFRHWTRWRMVQEVGSESKRMSLVHPYTNQSDKCEHKRKSVASKADTFSLSIPIGTSRYSLSSLKNVS